jgi:hypothetical protein
MALNVAKEVAALERISERLQYCEILSPSKVSARCQHLA